MNNIKESMKVVCYLKLFNLILRKLFDLILAKSQEEKESRLSFLDGFRGSLALVVIATHVKKDSNCELFNIIYGIHRTYAVDGFFVLSAFLLTYRLLTELRKASNFKQELLIIVKYCVRRFFRIYVVFVLFASVIKFGPDIAKGNYKPPFNIPPYPMKDNFAPWTTLITLKDVGYNHLWTIAPEIKYYFCIPFVCLIGKRFGRFLFAYLILCCIWLYYNEQRNFFGLTINDLDNIKGSRLKPRFAVFFYGSTAGIALCLIESSSIVKSIVNNELARLVLGALSMYTFYYGVRYRNGFYLNNLATYQLESLSAFVWSSFILLLSAGHPNFTSRLFGDNGFMRNCGKYSFGMYLLHPIAIHLVTTHFQPMIQTAAFVCVTLISYFQAFWFFTLIEDPLVKLANRICKLLDKLHSNKTQSII